MKSTQTIAHTVAMTLAALSTMAPHIALAQEQLIGNVEVGSVFGNSNYGGLAFAGSGNTAYSLLTNGMTTYVNAASASNSIIFRGNNTANPSVSAPDDPNPSRAYIDSNSNMVVAGSVIAGRGFTPNTTAITGYSIANTRIEIDPFAGTGVGVAGDGDNIGVFAASSSSTGDFTHGPGLYAVNQSPNAAAVVADSATLAAGSIAMYATTSSTTKTAVYAKSGSSSSGLAYYGVGNITITGNNASKAQGGSWNGTSDIRTKTAVEPFTQGLEALAQVNPISYRFNGLGETLDDGKRYVGVSAQDLQTVLPAMVGSKVAKMHSSDKEPTVILQVDPSDFTYLLINAVKELHSEVRELRGQLQALQKQKR